MDSELRWKTSKTGEIVEEEEINVCETDQGSNRTSDYHLLIREAEKFCGQNWHSNRILENRIEGR